MKTRFRRIGPRISLQLLALLAAVFLCVFAALNLFFRNYVNSNARSQLDAIEQAMTETVSGGRDEDADGGARPKLPDLSSVLHNTIRSEAKVFNLDGAYALTDYDQSDDPAELTAVAAALRAENVPLAAAKYVHLRTDAGEYYVSSITDPVIADTYMVFSLNVSAVRELWNTVNAALAAIMAAAVLVCLFFGSAIARSVTQPVRELSDFAESLGGGDFTRRDLRFRDQEFQELSDAMNRSAEKLGEYDREQRTFFQNVSHELRTPLMSIRCYAEGVSCGVMDPKQSGAVILTETDRLSELVEDLLYISRIDRCPVPEKAEEGDLRETVSLCASGLRALADKGHISFRYEFDEAPVRFTYNENHMCRAVNNLLSNALRYAKSEIALGCRNVPGGVEITVADDGEGVSPEDLPHVFDRFYKGKGGKAGIGLAIVRSVAELYGGEAEALPGPGGRFVLRFPTGGCG